MTSDRSPKPRHLQPVEQRIMDKALRRSVKINAQTTGGGRKVLRATGWAMLDHKGKILVNSIRARAEETRLSAGEGTVYPVTIFLEMETK